MPRGFVGFGIYYMLFIGFSVDGHLGCFHFLPVMNNAGVNIHIYGFV